MSVGGTIRNIEIGSRIEKHTNNVRDLIFKNPNPRTEISSRRETLDSVTVREPSVRHL